MFLALRERTYDDLVIDYLLVDSDPKSFRDDDPAWSVLGRSIALPKKSQLPLQIDPKNLVQIIDDINSHPNLKTWIGDRQGWGEILASLNIDAAAGQKRRLGRFLFAMSVRKFRDAVTQLVRDMQQQGNRSTDITFHIFCGLAGGTGSGSIVDAVAQIRQAFPDLTQRILLYCYLPDLNPPAAWARANYHANAYAALLELNAMSAGSWAPFDVHSGLGRAEAVQQVAFNGAYLFTDANDQGYRANIERDLPEIVADFVFHKIVVAHRVSWPNLSTVENAENGDSTPETAKGSKIGQRSVRFLGFGIRRIAFPEELMREALTYEFELQALRQLAFNNWQDGAGYLEQPKPRADADFVASAQQREAWRLTDDHLRLQRPIIDSEGSRSWQDFAIEWQTWETHYVPLAQQTERAQWLNELKALFHAAWSSSFRGAGVSQFFEYASRDRSKLAVEIRGRVEASLFDDWRNGERAICDCAAVVGALIEDVSERREKFADYVKRRDDATADLDRQFGLIEARWSKTRLLPGSRERELTKAGLLQREKYLSATLAQAGRFARALCEELVTQLTNLKSAVELAQKVVTETAEQAQKHLRARQLSSDGKTDGSDYITYVGNFEKAEATRRRLALSEDEQRTHASLLRQRINGALGGAPTFQRFSQGFVTADIRNIILATSEESMASAHQRLITSRSDRVIGVSVIEKLREEWGDGQERLDREAAHLARSAGRFISFDEAERNKSFPGRTTEERAIEYSAVLLPAAPEHRDFTTRLETAFKNARRNTDMISAGDQSDQLALVTIVNLFPLRFSRLVRSLKDRYELRLAQSGRARAALEVHIEGDGTQFPDIFAPDSVAVTAQLRPLLLLTVAHGAARRMRPRNAGRDQLVLLRKDENGLDMEPFVLGADLPDAAGSLGEADLYVVRDVVRELLGDARNLSDAAIGAALDKMKSEIEAVRKARDDDPIDPEVAAWNGAARDAMKMMRKEIVV